MFSFFLFLFFLNRINVVSFRYTFASYILAELDAERISVGILFLCNLFSIVFVLLLSA